MARYFTGLKRTNSFLGSGFTELIPAMDTPSRGGTDGNNENVHNFSSMFLQGEVYSTNCIIFCIFLSYKTLNTSYLFL